MVTVVCWLVIHTSHSAKDNRSYKPHRGVVMAGDHGHRYIDVNFYDDFIKKKIDMTVNNVTQLVEENECIYEPNP